MASNTFYYYLILFIVSSSSSSVMASNPCFFNSTAALFSKESSSLTTGACGYGALATRLLADHRPAAVTGSLYHNGAGCGSCYRVRCKNQTLCNKIGARVIVTDLNKNTNTDFQLTRETFVSMAKDGKARDILEAATPTLDFEYKWEPCTYKKYFSVRIQESSKKPNYLAIQLLYQGGQTEIEAIDIAKAGGNGPWHAMKRKYGAIWETNEVPVGGMQFHFFLSGDDDFVWAKNVIPADWKIGAIYDSGLQITQIIIGGCLTCINSVQN